MLMQCILLFVMLSASPNAAKTTSRPGIVLGFEREMPSDAPHLVGIVNGGQPPVSQAPSQGRQELRNVVRHAPLEGGVEALVLVALQELPRLKGLL